MKNEAAGSIIFLLSRLERISADSVVAHRASGVRGAMLRILEKPEQASEKEVDRLIESAYDLLVKAAREKSSSLITTARTSP